MITRPSIEPIGESDARRSAIDASVAPVTYSVVIPSYDSRESIGELIERLEKIFAEQLHASYEIVIVDDASPDSGTWPAIVEVVQRHRHVRALRLTRNFGRTAAVLCGMERARGEWIITMDDDLQHRPEDLPKLARMRDHDAIVADFGFRDRHHSWAQRLTSLIRAWFDHKLLGIPRHIRMSPYMMIRGQVVRMMLESRTPYPFIPALLFHVTHDVVSVPATHDPRRYGKSQFGFRLRVQLFSNLLINNSSFVLRAIALIGAIAATSSLLLAVFLVANRLLSKTVLAGWTSLAVGELFFGGLILLSIGVIGEYLVRIIQLAEQRPTYFVRTEIEGRPPATK